MSGVTSSGVPSPTLSVEKKSFLSASFFSLKWFYVHGVLKKNVLCMPSDHACLIETPDPLFKCLFSCIPPVKEQPEGQPVSGPGPRL